MVRPHLSHARPQAPQTSPTWRAISRHQETWQAPQKVERLRQRGPQALQHGQRLVQVNPRQIKVATASIQRREGCYNNPGWAREGPPRAPTPEADARSPSSVMKGIYIKVSRYITSFKISSFPFAEILKRKCWSFYAFEWIKLISLSRNFEKMLKF